MSGSSILEHTLVYRLWQTPFAEKKLAPLLAHNDLSRARHVLDVACGPGTNARHFTHCDYAGIDLNPRYIAAAKRRFRGEFLVADATNFAVPAGKKFDFILVNSFLHHVGDAETVAILRHLRQLLEPQGHIHVLELVQPPQRSLAGWLARLDRGKFARPLAEWQGMFSEAFFPVVFQPYVLTGFGTVLWNMVYFKGRTR